MTAKYRRLSVHYTGEKKVHVYRGVYKPGHMTRPGEDRSAIGRTPLMTFERTQPQSRAHAHTLPPDLGVVSSPSPNDPLV